MTDGFLNKTYEKTGTADLRDHYDAWSASYDKEISGNGYATPRRCAAALAQHVPDKSTPLLDFGCGTGLSGLALRLAGFETIDGVDLSLEMLKKSNETNTYRSLIQAQIDKNLAIPQGVYANIAAIGSIGAGAAPFSMIHQLMHLLTKGGKMVFSFNDHALADPASEGTISEWTDVDAARLLFKEHGDHLPGINLKSNVYILEKT